MYRLIVIAFLCVFPVGAYAYIDPGTGSLWLQYLIGGLASLYFLVKVYYGKIKEKLIYDQPEAKIRRIQRQTVTAR